MNDQNEHLVQLFAKVILISANGQNEQVISIFVRTKMFQRKNEHMAVLKLCILPNLNIPITDHELNRIN